MLASYTQVFASSSSQQLVVYFSLTVLTSRTYLGLGQNTESTRNNTTQQNNHADF